MKILLISLSVFLMTGCCSKNPINDLINDDDNLAKGMHKQGYFNCINSGGSKGYCSKVHNYRE